MKKVKVTNKGNKKRERLGSRFIPKDSKILEVNSRQYMTLKSVKDFEVEVLDEYDKKRFEAKKEDDVLELDQQDGVIDHDVNDQEKEVFENEEDQEDAFDYDDLTINDVLKAVDEGVLSVDEAIAKEVAGKNRVTLLDKLEDQK